jgi:hypothetical protein
LVGPDSPDLLVDVIEEFLYGDLAVSIPVCLTGSKPVDERGSEPAQLPFAGLAVPVPGVLDGI